MSTLTAPADLFGLLRFRGRPAPVSAGVEAAEGRIRAAGLRKEGGAGVWSFAVLDEEEPGHAGSGFLRFARPGPGKRGPLRGAAICALSSASVDVFPLTLRKDERDPLDGQVVRQAADHLGDRLEESVLDYALPPEETWRPGDDAIPALVFAARRELVEGVLARLERAGLKADRLVTPACALAPHVAGAGPGVRHLLVAAGDEATSLSIAENGHVLLERIIPWGSRGLLERLRTDLELDENQSRLLLTDGPRAIDGEDDEGDAFDPEGTMKGALRQVLEPDYQELVREASGCLGYVNSFLRPAGAAGAILTGAMAGNAGLRLFLEEGLGLPVTGAEEGLRLPGFDGSGKGASFAVAAGCALWPEEEER